ncbi:SusC/RagA family TonB-linked outer membrane protein [Tamlana fucoidanivorans]|uniref:SusC/RagA family TonB-linked outer membrane protein n=1 Tax=Allotamlana fucoidanivorans TaxID=2583814 RepID=A0A5C4SMU1_9FLAO|nr:SusC/RagA family TonB-linked outer membrane protein [Tamlana fucoidanivorans]TNJ45021.1 SusC/RagA family TonB-linked outer membrane protein [Tamlana fucoidanivorans]
MKIYKIYKLYALVCIAMLCFCEVTTAQSDGVKVSATVVDEQGNPLEGVYIYGPKGVKSSTNTNGLFDITLPDDETVVIEKKGYESQLVSLTNWAGNITLKKSEFLASEDDEINMGVGVKNRRDVVGSISSTNTRDRLVYDNTQFVRDYISGLTMGVRGSDNIRGLDNALFVIDGVFGRDPNVLNMEEVDQITILRDANAVALYGSQGRNGVIVINTKRGKINKREVNVNVRSGIRTPISLPNYLGSADYMELWNEARINDGTSPDDTSLFSMEDIANTRNGINPIKYPDVDFYDQVQPFVNTTNVITEFTGGNDKSQYYVNVGWLYNEDWLNINEDINAGSNRFNVRGNIDFKVNDWITSSIDGVAIISTDKSARANLLSAGTTFKPNDYAPLLPLEYFDTENNPELAVILAGARYFNGGLLGSNRQVQENAPVARAIAGGYQNNVFRVTQFNNAINFDLSGITEGLSAKTYLSFDFFDSYQLSIRNEYRVYEPFWKDDKIVGFRDIDNPNLDESDNAIFGRDLRDLTENVSSNGFESRLGMYGLINYQKTFAQNHSIYTTLLGYYNSEKRDGTLQTDKDAHLGFQLTYDFKKKLYADFSGAYAHSIKLPEGNRGGFSPTVGVAYILSEEAFLKESNFINYLKLKASGGIIKSDRGIDGYYLYEENYSSGSSFAWADGVQSNRKQNVTQGANPDLGYEERIDFNAGFETYLMNSLWLEANYFRTELDKQLVFLADQYPSYYNTFRPRDNFNANLYTGFELGINFNKTFNDFTFGIGANVLYSQAEASKRSETNEFAYQNRQGKELSTIFGFEDQGFYTEADFVDLVDYELIAGLPEPQFGTVKPGDIKYKNQNGDDKIDLDDQVAIGQGSSPWTYGVNLNIKYKAFNLFILGTGQTGGLGNKLSDRYNDYYSPNGNQKYSEVVLGRWTPETDDTATFPRLSAAQNQNNFRNSTFWLFDTSFFRINRAQLTYEFADNLCDRLGMEHFSLNLQGTNLFEIAKNKDIRQLNIGTNPQARTYTLGVRLSF